MYRGTNLVLMSVVACAAAPPQRPTQLANLPPPTAASRSSASADPVLTDGDKYRVLLENQEVRVLRYHDEAGARTHAHSHPDSVVYALGPFVRELTSSDGKSHVRKFEAGDVAWVPAQAHVGRNVGSAPTDVLIVEIKARRP